jgi:hypothetical protein
LPPLSSVQLPRSEALTPLQMLSGLGVILGILLARRTRVGKGRAPA